MSVTPRNRAAALLVPIVCVASLAVGSTPAAGTAKASLAPISGLSATWREATKVAHVSWAPYAGATATCQIAVNFEAEQRSGPVRYAVVVPSMDDSTTTLISGGAVYSVWVEAFDEDGISPSTETTLVCPADTFTRVNAPRRARRGRAIKFTGYVYAGPDSPKPPGGNWPARGRRAIRITPYLKAIGARKFVAQRTMYAHLPGGLAQAYRSTFAATYKPLRPGAYFFRTRFVGTRSHRASQRSSGLMVVR